MKLHLYIHEDFSDFRNPSHTNVCVYLSIYLIQSILSIFLSIYLSIMFHVCSIASNIPTIWITKIRKNFHEYFACHRQGILG